MNDLADQLRGSVDHVPAVTFEEVVLRSGHGRSERPSRRLLIAAVVAVIAVVGMGFALGGQGSGRSTVQASGSVPSSQTTVGPSPCAPGQDLQGCQVSAEQAFSLLGFAPPTPSRMPSGWVTDVRAIVDYPPYTPTNPFDHDLLMLKQIWQRPGTDRADAQAEWASLEVRLSTPRDPIITAGAQVILTLSDGTQVRGTSGPATIGVDPATSPTVEVTDLTWIRDGRWYRFVAHGISQAQAGDLVDSLSS